MPNLVTMLPQQPFLSVAADVVVRKNFTLTCDAQKISFMVNLDASDSAKIELSVGLYFCVKQW